MSVAMTKSFIDLIRKKEKKRRKEERIREKGEERRGKEDKSFLGLSVSVSGMELENVHHLSVTVMRCDFSCRSTDVTR